jgi:hypothetical protein
MKYQLLLITCWFFLAGSPTVFAEPVQSTTSTYVSLRSCIPGETLCDAIGPSRFKEIGGTPGSPEAQASQQNPEFGEAMGAAVLSGEPGAATLQAKAKSLPAARNAGTAFVLQRITNSTASAQTMTLEGTLVYDQEVPEENAAFPQDQGGRSGTLVELDLFTMTDDFVEAGTTAEENWAIMDREPPPDYQSLGSARTDGMISTVTEQDSKTFSISVVIESGVSIWMFALLQGIAANGAEVDAELVTSLAINPQ